MSAVVTVFQVALVSRGQGEKRKSYCCCRIYIVVSRIIMLVRLMEFLQTLEIPFALQIPRKKPGR